MSIRLIAFDLFGTVFQMAKATEEELRAYGAHLRQEEWSPLKLPDHWEHLDPFPDAQDGIARLRTKFTVVTFSNAPLGLQTRMLKNADLRFDAIVPLEIRRVFKPNVLAYEYLADVLGYARDECLMVSANKHFGDIENSRWVGLKSQLIRHEGTPKTIVELAESLGC